MEAQPKMVQTLIEYDQRGREVAEGWLMSLAAWSQFALLVGAWLPAALIMGRLRPGLARLLTPPEGQEGPLASARRAALMVLPLLMPLLAYGLNGMFESMTRSLFGAGEVIAFGKRLFLFLAVRLLVREIRRDPLLTVPRRFVLMPLALLFLFDLLGPASERLAAIRIDPGHIGLSLLALISGIVTGALLFRLGRWSKGQSEEVIRKPAELRPTILETVAGRQVPVPNGEVITSRVVDCSDAGKPHRREAPFSLSYGTDIDSVPAPIEAATALDFVRTDGACAPECELKTSADRGGEFSVEYRGEAIEIPFPQRVVHHVGQPRPA